MINARLDSPAARATARHAAQVYLAAIYTTAGIPVPADYLRNIVAARANRAAPALYYRVVRPGAEGTARPAPPQVEPARAQVMEMRARLARVEMGVLRARLA